MTTGGTFAAERPPLIIMAHKDALLSIRGKTQRLGKSFRFIYRRGGKRPAGSALKPPVGATA